MGLLLIVLVIALEESILVLSDEDICFLFLNGI